MKSTIDPRKDCLLGGGDGSQSRVGVEKEGSSRTAEKFSQRQEMRNSAWKEGTEEEREKAERGI